MEKSYKHKKDGFIYNVEFNEDGTLALDDHDRVSARLPTWTRRAPLRLRYTESRFLKMFVAALAVAALSGCTTSVKETWAPCEQVSLMQDVRISNNMPIEQIQQVVESVDAWCDAGIKCFDVSVTPREKANLYLVPNIPDAWGEYSCDMGHIWISENTIEYEQFTDTVMHELGHAIQPSKDHLEDSYSVMGVGRTTEALTSLDIEWASK